MTIDGICFHFPVYRALTNSLCAVTSFVPYSLSRCFVEVIIPTLQMRKLGPREVTIQVT